MILCLSYSARLKMTAALLLVGLAVPYPADADGHHNSTKEFTAPDEMVEGDWSDPAEMERTWQAALVRIPVGSSEILKSNIKDLDASLVPDGVKLPTVVYLHGCSGVWKGTYERIDLLTKNGFAVVAPVSFARKKYPMSCDTQTHTGGLYRPTLTMRQHDAGYAIKQVKQLPWVDADNVFLMGLSQGGITAATFHSDDPAARVRARVVEGWTCHAGWEEYAGINAPETEPVLTLVAEGDPWFQNPYSRGDCGRFLNKHNGSQSVVYRTGRLQNRHELLEFEPAQKAVITFLRKHLEGTE